MSGIIHIGDNELSITPIKYKKNIYWVTTPHGIFIERDKIYHMKFRKKIYKLMLKKQANWTDLAIFESIPEQKIPLKINQLKIIKAHPNILGIKIKNSQHNISGILSECNYSTYLDIAGVNRTLFYKIKLLNEIKPGMSGSAFYDRKDNLIGLVSHCDKDYGYLIPGFFILKLIDEESSDYSPYLPIKLFMEDGNIIVFEKVNDIERGFVIKYFDELKVTNGSIYSFELRDNIPIDIYLQIFCNLGKKLKISDGKINYELEVENLNNHLKFPFISGVSLEEKRKTSISYQDLWERKDNPIALKMINNNLQN